MFEDFSFSTPSSNGPARRPSLDIEDEPMVDCDSTLISPFSSRCPSPSRRLSRVSKPNSRSSHSRSQSFYARHLPPPTSIPDSHNAKRLSVGALTQKLHDHTLNHELPHSENASRRSSLAPPPPGPLAHSNETSPPSARRTSDLLTPPPDADADDEPSSQLQRTIRLQRQRLSRLQCAGMTASETVRLALLMEEDECLRFPGTADDEQHPSSLPPSLLSPMRKVAMNQSRRHYQRQNPDGSIAAIAVIGRSGSINRRGPLAAAGSSKKIEKSHFTSYSPSLYPSSRRASRGHGPSPVPASGAGHLQRKGGLVSAAVAAMMEGDGAKPPKPSGVEVHIDDVDGMPLPGCSGHGNGNGHGLNNNNYSINNGNGGEYYYHHEDYLNNPSSYRIPDGLLFSASPSANTTPAPSRRGSEITSAPAMVVVEEGK